MNHDNPFSDLPIYTSDEGVTIWVPFWFESNAVFCEVRSADDWSRVVRTWADHHHMTVDAAHAEILRVAAVAVYTHPATALDAPTLLSIGTRREHIGGTPIGEWAASHGMNRPVGTGTTVLEAGMNERGAASRPGMDVCAPCRGVGMVDEALCGACGGEGEVQRPVVTWLPSPRFPQQELGAYVDGRAVGFVVYDEKPDGMLDDPLLPEQVPQFYGWTVGELGDAIACGVCVDREAAMRCVEAVVEAVGYLGTDVSGRHWRAS